MEINLQQLVIRRVLTESDIELMATYRIEYLTEMLEKPENFNAEKLHSDFKKFITDNIQNGLLIALVAEYEAKPVSYGAIILRTVPGDFYTSTYLEGDILNMYTIPTARKQGISTVLLNKLISEARDAGVSKLSLHTTAAGEKLYRAAGFDKPIFPFLELATLSGL